MIVYARWLSSGTQKHFFGSKSKTTKRFMMDTKKKNVAIVSKFYCLRQCTSKRG